MPLTLGSGPSITDYSKEDIIRMAAVGFTFGVNYTAFDFHCDVIVALDFDFTKDNRDKIKAMGKPVVTRQWSSNSGLGLDLIEIPNDVGARYQFSGMLAAKLSDAVASECDGVFPAYVLGLDGGKGRYIGHTGKGPNDYTTALEDDYEALGLKNTINLSMRSKIKCWPKYSKLPHMRKYICPPVLRACMMAWIRANATKVLS